ncbi:MAG: Gfo/Idh/MocA family oxidoreductase [Phycisphaeraceae bacterium]
MTHSTTLPPTDTGLREPLPEIDLRQLLRLTDDTGIFQHATHLLPDPSHGYCTDDNARALIAAVLHAELRGYDEHTVPLQRYLAFVAYAFNPDNGRFRNFMSYDRRWLEEAGSEDSHGRALWALGVTVQRTPDTPVRDFADQLLHKGLSAVRAQLNHLRPWAFALLGLNAYLQARDDDHVRALRDDLAEKLYQQWRAHASDDWPWWEDILTWGNARLPHAMLLAGQGMGHRGMIDAALRALQWCLDIQTAPDGHLSIIGNDGWYVRGGKKAQFDQQPLEAYAFVDACIAAAEITDDPQWAQHAWRCFEWFRGRNDVGAPLYHDETGGCQDGLSAHGPNQNQGAESSLAYLLSVLALHHYHERRAGRVTVTGPQTLGLAVIGASRFARSCLEVYAGIDDLKPLAVWNRTTSRAEAMGEAFGIKAYAQLHDMLNDPAVHIVHVATAPALHAEHATAALHAGKHVLCEKPIATTLVDAQHMIQAATERDRRLAINHMMRYGPMYEPVRQLIQRNVLGMPLRGMCVNRAGDASLPSDHWFWDETVSGGIFIEHGVHFFDLAHGWLGDGRVIDAWQLYRPQTSLIDQVGCDVLYQPQTTVNFYHGFHQPSAFDEQDLRLIFERGELRLRGWIARELSLHAVLTEAQLAELQELLPEAEIETLQQFTGDQRRLRSRDRDQTVDREVRARWCIAGDRQQLYPEALRGLMEDMIASVRDPRHRMRATVEESRAALETALRATRLAKGAPA